VGIGRTGRKGTGSEMEIKSDKKLSSWLTSLSLSRKKGALDIYYQVVNWMAWNIYNFILALVYLPIIMVMAVVFAFYYAITAAIEEMK
jgi:hypothetical protein